MAWQSIGLGVCIGLFYAIVSYANARFAARRRAHGGFMAGLLGGMALRMVAALALMTFVLVRVSVQVPAFIASFLAAFMVGLVAEVAQIYREATARPLDE